MLVILANLHIDSGGSGEYGDSGEFNDSGDTGESGDSGCHCECHI